MANFIADPKRRVRDFWQERSCGEVYAKGPDLSVQFDAHRRARYDLEPYIPDFADFRSGQDKDVLEVGVGMGADHVEWAKQAPRSLAGIDFTPRAVDWTAQRLRFHGLSSGLSVADAERLPFADVSFDLVYSWGVLHHTPDTAAAINEVHRVLRPGGEARLMMYHARSMVGYLLWIRYGLLAGRPRRSLADIYASHLESPGTKAYTVAQAKELCGSFRKSEVSVRLGFGDLLQGEVGQQHGGALLRAAKAFWPRRLIQVLMPGHGLVLLIKAWK